MPVLGECRPATPAASGSISRSSGAVEPPQPRDVVRAGAALELVQPRELGVVDGHDELAAALVAHAVLVAELVQLAGAGDAQLGLQRAGRVVDAGVDDAGVVAGLVGGDAVLALEDHHGGVRPAVQQLAGGGEAEDAGPDDGDVVHQ